MSATILIKRTQGTSPPTAAPVGTGVSFGELIYTYDAVSYTHLTLPTKQAV